MTLIRIYDWLFVLFSSILPANLRCLSSGLFFLGFGEMREKILTMKVRTGRRVANLLIYFFTISSGNGLIKNMDMKKSKMLISRLSLRKALFNSV